MNIIVAVDNKNSIGRDDELLFRISSDLKNFKELTIGNVIIYGRKTLETFPGKKPLKNRINIIFSRNNEFKCDGAIVVHNIDELFDVIKDYDTSKVFVIGGEQIYNLLFDYCDTCYLTKINADGNGNRFFKGLNENWKTDSVKIFSEDNLNYTYGVYKKTTPMA